MTDPADLGGDYDRAVRDFMDQLLAHHGQPCAWMLARARAIRTVAAELCEAQS